MLQLRDIFKAPLDAAYFSLKESNLRSQKDMIETHFSTEVDKTGYQGKKYRKPVKTLRPLDYAIQFKNKHGTLHEITGPSIAFEHVTNLNVKDLIVDFEVGISEMRRHEDGHLVVNASLQNGQKGHAPSTGGFHFNIVYKNDVPNGIQMMQTIFADVLDGQYNMHKDNDDTALVNKASVRVANEKNITCLEEAVNDLLRTDQNAEGVLARLLEIKDREKDLVRNTAAPFHFTDEEAHAIMQRIPPIHDTWSAVLTFTAGAAGVPHFGLGHYTTPLVADVYSTDRLYRATGDVPTSDTFLAVPV